MPAWRREMNEPGVPQRDPQIENGVMKFHVALDPTAAPRLRSNARVDVYVVTDRRTKAEIDGLAEVLAARHEGGSSRQAQRMAATSR